MKVILVGGGTLGSVSPLIAIWQQLEQLDNKLAVLFVGTKNGPEKKFVTDYHLPYQPILAGKIRRYFSLENFVDLFKIVFSLIQSFFILKRFRPNLIISAGSFVAIPLVWLAKIWSIKVILLQLDWQLGLANKLMQRRADYIFTVFPETAKQFSRPAQFCGTVLRKEISQIKSLKSNNQQDKKILILGGSSGSQFLNDLILNSIEQLSKNYKIVQITGKNKFSLKSIQLPQNYQNVEFLKDDYYPRINEADLVISRAGLSTIMELSFFKKPVILIPLPNSSQEENANYLSRRQAVACLQQPQLTSAILIKTINQLINNQAKLHDLAVNLHQIFNHGGEKKIAQIIYENR